MRIWWQSFVDPAQNAPYLERLAAYLAEIADDGTTVDVHGLTPPDRDFAHAPHDVGTAARLRRVGVSPSPGP